MNATRTDGPWIIGVDFDNTLVEYDDLFWTMARERELIAADVPRNKREIRDRLRRLPDGEIQWQKLQAAAYGPQIQEARLAKDAAEFLRQCRQASAKVYVVSHKTEYAGYDETGTNLREAALEWMTANGLFRDASFGLCPGDVHFSATRDEKIARIRALGCTHFIDDLEETFREPSFPAEVKKILFAPMPSGRPLCDVKLARSWKEISEYVFCGGPGTTD